MAIPFPIRFAPGLLLLLVSGNHCRVSAESGVREEIALLKKQLAAGKGDGEILEWLSKNSKFKRTPSEIAAWSAYHEQRAPADVEGREYLHEVHKTIAPKREDIATWFDMLDLDDHVSFGGTA